MKRRELLQTIQQHGCILIRHGGNHDWFQNPKTKVSQAVPRHTEINEHLARRIIRMLTESK